MILLKLVPVKRCDNCYRLIPANSEHCPYCQGQGFVLKEKAPQPVVTPVTHVKGPVNRKPLWIALGVVAVIAIIGVCISVFSSGEKKSDNYEEQMPERVAYSSEEYTKTEPEEEPTVQVVSQVRVTGTNVRLRKTPEINSYNIIQDDYGYNVHPPKGDVLEVLGEEEEFYLVRYSYYEAYISKQFTVPVEYRNVPVEYGNE